MKTYAIIPSGGESKRFGGEIPKQYFNINGKEIIVYTLEVFQNCELIDEIVIAAKPEYFALLNEIKEKYKPVYYALLSFMGEKYSDEFKKMGSELKETVDEIITEINRLSEEYK